MEIQPSEANRKEHKLWQVTCKVEIRSAKKEFEEQIAQDAKANNQFYQKQEACERINRSTGYSGV